jgi:hypothetical protein
MPQIAFVARSRERARAGELARLGIVKLSQLERAITDLTTT